MKRKELFQLGLPKWPALLVKGNPVTPKQAQEILLRTDGLLFCSNDHNFEKELNSEIYGVYADFMELDEALRVKHNIDKNDYHSYYDLKKTYLASYRLLNLDYLKNSRIVSSWIGGPHGWCNWNGYIGCNNYNIGKYPSIEDVYNEWKIIAKAFPFIDLKCQLLNGEAAESDTVHPVIEYTVKNGKVTMKQPKVILDHPNSDINTFIQNMMNPRRERGCTIEVFRSSLQYVKNKFMEDEAYLKEVKDYTKP